MKLIFEDMTLLYKIIDLNTSISENGLSGHPPNTEFLSQGSVTCGPVELPYPFEKLFLNTRRLENYFNTYISIIPRCDDAFFNSTEKVSQGINSLNNLDSEDGRNNYLFHPTSEIGTGYIIEDPKNDPRTFVSIFDYEMRKKSARTLSIGDFGSRPQRFIPDCPDNELDFCRSISRLVKIGEVYINSCLSDISSSFVTNFPDDIKIYLHP